MRKNQVVLVLSTFLFLCCSASFARWPISNPDSIGFARVCYLSPSTPEDRQKRAEDSIYSNFDPACLSNKEASIKVDFTVDSLGLTRYNIAQNQSSTPADRFYCEQAIWESTPMDRVYESHGTCLLGSNQKSHATLSELQGDKARLWMHFVPESVLSIRSYGVLKLTIDDIHCKENVVSIAAEDWNNPKLEKFRTDWTNFVKNSSPLTRSDVVSYAELMHTKYDDLFQATVEKKEVGTIVPTPR